MKIAPEQGPSLIVLCCAVIIAVIVIRMIQPKKPEPRKYICSITWRCEGENYFAMTSMTVDTEETVRALAKVIIAVNGKPPWKPLQITIVQVDPKTNALISIEDVSPPLANEH